MVAEAPVGGGAREAETGQGGHHHAEGVGRVCPVGSRVGQERRQLGHLEVAARPAVDQEQGQRGRSAPLQVGEVDGAVDGGHRLGQGVQLGLAGPPVELVVPVGHQLGQVGGAGAVVPAGPGRFVGQAGAARRQPGRSSTASSTSTSKALSCTFPPTLRTGGPATHPGPGRWLPRATGQAGAVASDGRRGRRREAVKLLGVAPQDLVLDLGGEAGRVQALLGQLDRVGPGGVRVGVVHLDHHVVLAHHVEHAEPGGVVDEAAVEVLPVVLVDVDLEDVDALADPWRGLPSTPLPPKALALGHPVALGVAAPAWPAPGTTGSSRCCPPERAILMSGNRWNMPLKIHASMAPGRTDAPMDMLAMNGESLEPSCAWSTTSRCGWTAPCSLSWPPRSPGPSAARVVDGGQARGARSSPRSRTSGALGRLRSISVTASLAGPTAG